MLKINVLFYSSRRNKGDRGIVKNQKASSVCHLTRIIQTVLNRDSCIKRDYKTEI